MVARNNHGLQCWLLELIDQARSEDAFPLLVAQLHSPDDSARRALYQARLNGEIP